MSVQDLASAVATALAVALLLSVAWVEREPVAQAVSAAPKIACVEGRDHSFSERHRGDYCPIPRP
jgi:hypothetical protein